MLEKTQIFHHGIGETELNQPLALDGDRAVIP